MRFLFLTALLLLPACAYVFDKHIQDIEFTTTSAEDAACNVYVAGLRYKVHPPQTINVANTHKDMIIDCLAPGNRRQKLEVEADLNSTTLLNVGNAGIGLPWDFASGAAFKFPDRIDVDFTGIEATSQPFPAQNNPDIKQPEEYRLEEFSPGKPRLNEDRHDTEPEIMSRRLPSYEEESSGAAGAEDKGALMKVIQDLRNEVDPAAPKAAAEEKPSGNGASLPGDGADPLGGDLPPPAAQPIPLVPQYPGQ